MHLNRLLDHAAAYHGDREIVSEGQSPGRTCWAQIRQRAQHLTSFLLQRGTQPGDRVATIAWNSARHIEAWFGIMGAGAVVHTINPRLFDDQIEYICNDAAPRVLFVDPSIVPVLKRLWSRLRTVDCVVVFASSVATDKEPFQLLCHEDLIECYPASPWVPVPDSAGAGLCYTSGTTGPPKGVLYSHFSSFLHAYAAASPDGFNVSSRSTIMPIVPMYHANGWGLPYVAAATGAKLVLTGSIFDPATILRLIRTENVTLAAGVPTIWRGVLDQLKLEGGDFGGLKEILIGGAPAPSSLIDTLEHEFGISVTHAWGMTELSPIGTVGKPSAAVELLPPDEQRRIRCKQGRPLAGIELALRDDKNREVPRDGSTPGRLHVRGPWVVQRYFNATSDSVDADGWFDTGDIATIDAYGYMQIVDRAKDLIKSGGEWISSVALEEAALRHPDIVDAAAIGMPHPKWDERPLLIVVVRAGAALTSQQLEQHLSAHVAKWWLPDEYRFMAAIARTSTGKIDKVTLRREHIQAQEAAYSGKPRN
jgi:acyl-CoA synthetase (AMP-forming)/AMP-acid ligase II